MGRDDKRRQLLSHLPRNAICAEIGVWNGGFSEEILEITQPRLLHLIDPWEFQPEYGNSAFGREAHRDAMDDKYKMVCEKFRGDKRVKIHRAMSHDALKGFEDASLDWVYIDGNHNYEVVSQDLELCLRKVKPNGIISGDDFFWQQNNRAPVRIAVKQVVRRLGDSVKLSKIGQQYMLDLNRA